MKDEMQTKNLGLRRPAGAETDDFLDGARFGVIGAGKSGRAALELLRTLGRPTVLFDDFADPADPALTALAGAGVELRLGPAEGRADALLEGLDRLVASPGVRATHPLLEAAARRSTPVRSEIELGWLCAPEDRFIAITGTNGKTTVTMLAEQLCRDAGLATAAVGNIGTALCAHLVERGPRAAGRTLALEVSSFQLETVELFAPEVAVILNITPDHLDRHHSMEEYARIKRRITGRQGADQALVVNQDDPFCLAAAQATRARVLRFSLERPVEVGAWLDGDMIMLAEPDRRPHTLMSMDELALLGLHNVANAMAVACVGLALGIGRKQIAATLKAFRAAPHRLELVGSRDGVSFVNDSKATNLDAMLRALESFPGRVRLIAGGRDKDSPFASVSRPVAEGARAVYTIGEAAGKIAAAWGAHTRVIDCGTLPAALAAAAAQAEPGDVVLLSPGCASFDQFSSYAERGEVFRRWVRAHCGDAPDD